MTSVSRIIASYKTKSLSFIVITIIITSESFPAFSNYETTIVLYVRGRQYTEYTYNVCVRARACIYITKHMI